MIYLNKYQDNNLKIKISDSYINTNSGDYVLRFTNLQDNTKSIYQYKDISTLKNVYSVLLIPRTDLTGFAEGDYAVEFYDLTATTTVLLVENCKVFADNPDTNTYYSASTSTYVYGLNYKELLISKTGYGYLNLSNGVHLAESGTTSRLTASIGSGDWYFSKYVVNNVDYSGSTTIDIVMDENKVVEVVFLAYCPDEIQNKLPITTFNSFTATTLPSNYYNKVQINSYTGKTANKVQTLATGSTISWNMLSGNTGVLTLVTTGTTVSNPTNINAGNTYKLVVKQNSAGSKTITSWGNYFKFPAAVKPVLTSTANSVDIIEFFAETNTVLYLNNFISNLS